MTYIENIFLCLAIPMILSLFFTKGRARNFTLFATVGMGICLLSAYVNSFFMEQYGVDGIIAAIEITPVCEEVMKLLPLLFYFLIFEPEPKELPSVAIAIAVGFATFENVCYLTENGASNFSFLLIRGISAGALHILCGVLSGFGISCVPPPLAGDHRNCRNFRRLHRFSWNLQSADHSGWWLENGGLSFSFRPDPFPFRGKKCISQVENLI